MRITLLIYFVLSTNQAIRARFQIFNRTIDFVVDSGASCCIIEQAYLPKWIRVNDDRKITIKGVNGVTTSLGYVNTYLQYGKYKFPIIFNVVRNLPNNVNGLIGTDFLKTYKSKIDFETSCLKIMKNQDIIEIPIEQTGSSFLTIPARTEIVTYVSTNETQPCVVLNQQLMSNVFIANSLSNPIHGRIPVRMYVILQYK